MTEPEMFRADKLRHPFRSEPMVMVQIFMQREAAHASVHEIAELGIVQFIDCDSNCDKTAFQRQFVSEVRLCDDMLRQLRLFRARAEKLGLPVDTKGRLFLTEEKRSESLSELSATYSELEKELKELQLRGNIIGESVSEKKQHRMVVGRAIEELFSAAPATSELPAETQSSWQDGAGAMEEGRKSAERERGALQITWGTLDVDRQEAFERLLFRATRGNAIFKTAARPETFDKGDEQVQKVAFAIFCFGASVQKKVSLMCQSIDARVYKVPRGRKEQAALLEEIERELDDCKAVGDMADRRQCHLLEQVAATLLERESWLLKEKAVYVTMNQMNTNVSNKAVVAEGWVPVSSVPALRSALQRGMRRAGASTASVTRVVETQMTPPTLIKTNKLTSSFQALNDAYGTPRYLELNPGTFYPVTYAFLFGIMFGDIGHGILLLLGAVGLIAKEHAWGGKKLNELLQPAFDGRYVLLLMALFSIYCGAVYNECFGISLIPWSYWALDCPEEGGPCAAQPIAPPGFGVDPIWGIAENKLGFQNSFKMKVSIIIGVCQMVFGLSCKTSNCLYFKKWKDLLFENIPEYVFLLSLFGYLCVIIVYKWSVDWVGLGLAAPPLLDTLLGMLLDFGKPIPPEMQLYPGQATVQTVLVVIAVLSVPCMMFPKPLLLAREHKKVEGNGYEPLELTDATEPLPRVHDAHGDGHEGHGEFDFADCMIHQSIHVIEFVLGSVSNTASYLRLWALSLAHAGLSEVFWERVILAALEVEDTHPTIMGVYLFFAFAVWASLTFGVLMVMETLSACLHDIRLHWVEFQNKFYGGDGHRFQPLSFDSIIHEHIHGSSE